MKTFLPFKWLPLVAASAALFGSGAANALTLTLFDQAANAGAGYTKTITSAGDSVNWSGDLLHGTTWHINVSGGESNTGGNPSLDLTSLDVSGGAGTLVITLWDTYTPPYPTNMSFITASGGTTIGTIKLAYAEFAAGTAPGGSPSSGLTQSFNTASFSGVGAFANSQGSGSLDLEIKATITHSRRGATSFNAKIRPVPIPAAALLFGSALLGMAGVGRRKVAQG